VTAGRSGSFGPWLFSGRPNHATRLTTSCAGHWFADLATRSGHPDVTPHRLRHTVATVLVGRGDILQAQHRLGHRDASTTLRIYSHAMPLNRLRGGGDTGRVVPVGAPVDAVRRGPGRCGNVGRRS
jgi:integrase